MGDRLLVDTDTASDDAMALVLAARSDRVAIEAVTTVAGNVPLDRATENAKYTLDLAGADATVHEGADGPLVKGFETAEDVHGAGGMGGDLVPETDIPSGEGHAAERIVERARAEPGDITLVCLGPLTNVALALALEPDLNDYLDSVWIMGGAANTLGNVTPAAEFNFWVDPDAAKRVLADLDATLVDWGLCVRDGQLPSATAERIVERAGESRFAELFAAVSPPPAEGVVHPDAVAVATLLEPDLVESSGTYHVDVNERAGMTRGYSLVDERGVLDAPARTRVIESIDADGYAGLFERAMIEGEL